MVHIYQFLAIIYYRNRREATARDTVYIENFISAFL